MKPQFNIWQKLNVHGYNILAYNYLIIVVLLNRFDKIHIPRIGNTFYMTNIEYIEYPIQIL